MAEVESREIEPLNKVRKETFFITTELKFKQ